MAFDWLQTPIFSGLGAIESWLESERDHLALWLPVMLGVGIAFWFVLPDQTGWIYVIAGGLALALLGAFGRGERLGQALLWSGLMLALGCALVWARADMKAHPVLARPMMATVEGRVESVDLRPAQGKVRLVVARSGAHALEIAPMPDAFAGSATCAVLRLPVDSGDWRLRHKTTDRHFYNTALDAAKGAGAQEALLLRDDGLVTEGSFTNLFVERDGVLLTPPARLGLLPGVLRASLIAEGHAEEADLTLGDLSDGFLIGNALRGLMPAKLMT